METPILRRGTSRLMAAAIVLTLGACGGSNRAQPDAPGSAQSSQAQPEGGGAVPSNDSGASTPTVNPVVNTGFQVGTTTYDPALPPEPVMPTDAQICATLPAKLTANADGLLPDSADAANTAPDTSAIQTALTGCTNAASTRLATNKVVHLTQGAGGENAFIAGALNLPSGVTLWIDKGVTLYASRDPRRFDKVSGTASCGLITDSDNGCLALITASKTSNSAVIGDGTIDGRGGSPLVSSVANDPNLLKRPGTATAMSWWDIGWMANVVMNKSQNNPRLIQISNGRNFTLYRVTLQNAPKFHVVPSGVEGFTAWGVKIYTPTAAYEKMNNYLGAPYSPVTAKNTDGIDPASSGPITKNDGNPGKLAGDMSNVLIAYTSIRTGDDNMAIKGGTGTVNGRTYNITVAHSHFYEGHGMSIGSETAGTDNGAANPDVAGVNGVLPSVSNVNVYDLVIDGADNGLRIKSDWSRSGLISNIRYSDVCIRSPQPTASVGSPQALIFSPYYSPAKNGGLYPNMQGIALDGVRIVNRSGYTFQGFNSDSQILRGSGWSAGTIGFPAPPVVNPLLVSLNNVVADEAPRSMSMSDAQFSVGAGGTSLSLQATDSVTITRAAPDSSVVPVDCSKAFVPMYP